MSEPKWMINEREEKRVIEEKPPTIILLILTGDTQFT